MTVVINSCPDCSAQLAPGAHSCRACGWSARPRGKGESPEFNCVCTWSYGADRCVNPVSQFRAGERSGFCIFHRQNPTGRIAADIAKDSHTHDAESYIHAAKAEVYGSSGGYGAEKRKKFLEAGGKRAGSFGNLEHLIALCKSRGVPQ